MLCTSPARDSQLTSLSFASFHLLCCGLIVATLGAVAVPTASAADWTQYLRDAAHTADARDERLTVPLHLAACVALDDAVLTSPAVVGDRVYVVDQMGSAYCVDPQRAAIVWKTHPLGAGAVGGNTSSPCVVDGKMAYGTTAGNFYLLDAKTGQVLRVIKFNHPIFGAITAANGRYYLQSLDGVIHCLDGSGTTCWQYDP